MDEQEHIKRLATAISIGRVADIKRVLASGVSPNGRITVLPEGMGEEELQDALAELGIETRHATPEKMWTTPLQHALSEQCKPDVVRLLLEAGADPNGRDGMTMTPLMRSHHVQVTRMLLAAGAELNATEEQGRTALFFSPRADITKALLEAGADPNAQEQDGATPLMYAKTPAVAQALLAAGAESEVRDAFGRTALHTAAMLQNLSVVRFWLQQGMAPDIKDSSGKTAYDYAESLDDCELMDLLVPDDEPIWF